MPDQSEIDTMTREDDRMRKFARSLAPHLARELGPHTCLHFDADEAAALRSVVKWGRYAIGAVILSATTGILSLLIAAWR